MSNQDNWFRLCDHFGSEEAANAEVVRQLRLFADLIEKEGYPKILACELSIKPGKNGFTDSFMERITVSISEPWPG